MEIISDLFSKLSDVQELVRWAGYIGLFAIVFAETGLLIGFFLPGDSLLFTAGLFAAKGDFEITFLILILIIAAIIGDAVGYNIGKHGGTYLYSRPETKFFKRSHLIKTKEFYEKYGNITIVLARFMPFARTFAPVVAGIAQMQYKKFAKYNILGGIGWISSMTLLGYFLGTFIPNIEKYIYYIIILIVLLSISPGIFKYIQIKRKGNL